MWVNRFIETEKFFWTLMIIWNWKFEKSCLFWFGHDFLFHLSLQIHLEGHWNIKCKSSFFVFQWLYSLIKYFCQILKISKHFYAVLFNPCNNPKYSLLIYILLVRKVLLRGVKWIARVHIAIRVRILIQVNF